MKKLKDLRSFEKGKLVPVKYVGNKLVRVKEVPNLESKKLKEIEASSSVSFSTERSNRIISNRVTRNGLDKLMVELTKKYEQLIEDVKNETEMIGTVEENIGEYPNMDPFAPTGNIHTQSHISNGKKVFFRNSDTDEVVFKVLDSKLYLTIYNKPPPKKQFFRRSEINQIIKIQNKFKGVYVRQIEKCVDKLKAEGCILEAMLLLIGRAYDNALKKNTWKKFKKEFHDPFNNINDELRFEDKIQFKLPNRFYNISVINNLNLQQRSPRKNPEKSSFID